MSGFPFSIQDKRSDKIGYFVTSNILPQRRGVAELRMEKEKYYKLSSEILDSAISVHKEMGPGLLESVYQECMVKELTRRNIKVQTNFAVPLIYKGDSLNKIYLADLIIENEIVGELKSVEIILPVHEAQIISYLKLSKKKLGFLINFNVPLLKNGFHRYVNGF